MFFIAYTFKGQLSVFAGRVNIVSHSSCKTSAILKYFCPLNYRQVCVKIQGLLKKTFSSFQELKAHVLINTFFEPKIVKISYPSVLGAHKNHLIELVLLSTHNICVG